MFASGSASAFLLAFVVGQASAQNFGCYPNCWERCLSDNGPYTWQYWNLNSMISKARGLRYASGAVGTAFILDSTASDNSYDLETYLAAILAISLPVEFNDRVPTRSCNPFFYSQYFEFGTAAAFNPQYMCLDHCEAAEVLMNLNNNLPEGSGNPHDDLPGGCWSAHFNRLNPAVPCAPEEYSHDEMAIAFINSRNQGEFSVEPPLPNPCNNFNARMLVNISPGWVNSFAFNTVYNGNWYSHWVSSSMLGAAERLFKCMFKSCCRFRAEVEFVPAKTVDVLTPPPKGRLPTADDIKKGVPIEKALPNGTNRLGAVLKKIKEDIRKKEGEEKKVETTKG